MLSVGRGINECYLLYSRHGKLDSLFPLQRRWPSWRSTWCFSDKSMSSCRRNWQRQRRDAPFWPRKQTRRTAVSPSSAVSWRSWPTSMSRNSTGELLDTGPVWGSQPFALFPGCIAASLLQTFFPSVFLATWDISKLLVYRMWAPRGKFLSLVSYLSSAQKWRHGDSISSADRMNLHVQGFRGERSLGMVNGGVLGLVGSIAGSIAWWLRVDSGTTPPVLEAQLAL